MKILLKILTITAAFGFTPAAAAVAPGTGGNAAQAAALPAGGAQPQDVSPAAPVSAGEEPSDAVVAQATAASRTTPQPGIGQPDGRMGLQDQFTPIGEEAAWFHDVILLPIITIISIFVLLLMVYVVIRFRRAANPIPSRTTHNVLIEVIWIVIPVLILAAMALPSFKLLSNQYDPPRADITVKAIGNQWYWTYQYPDNGDFEVVSNVLSDEEAKKRGEPRLLGADERMVVPAGATVKVIVTSNDVIHAFGVPAFWVKIDAVPGRLNETWFKVDKPGLYYGQCYELCGARHGYMPIAVEVVSREQFAAWVASKGGTMPGGARPVSSDATVNSPISNVAAGPVPTAGGSATETSPEPMNIVDGVATPPVSTQGATNSRRGGSQ